MVDFRQIEDLKKLFDDLGVSIKDAATNNKDLFEAVEDHLGSIVETVTKNVTEDYLKSVEDSTEIAINSQEEINGIIGELKDKFKGLDELSEVSKKLENKISEISNSFDKIKLPKNKNKNKKKKGKISGAIGNPLSALRSGINKITSKGGLTLGKGLLGGLIGMMVYGIKDRFRVQAEAGELKNILITATDATTGKVVANATSKLSSLQERLQRFYGINRKDVQGVIQSYVDGGVKIQDMLKDFPKDLEAVEDNYTTALLAIDKFLEVPGGWAAKKSTQMMADYGKSFEDSAKSVASLVISGKESGIGIQQFIKNIEETREGLIKYGFDVDSVVDLSLSLQKGFEDMGVPRQFAGRQAALGLKQMASGISGMDDKWKVLIAEKMNFATGLAGRQRLMESWKRVATGDNKEELAKFINAFTEIALEAAGGKEGKARYILEKSMGLGFEGSNAAIMLHKFIKSGKIEKAVSYLAENKDLFVKSITTEKEKANELLMIMNEFLKGMSKMGQAIFGMIADSLAMLIAYFRSVPTIFSNWLTNTKESRSDNARIMKDISSFFHDDYISLAKDGYKQSITAAKKGGFAILGKSLEGFMESWSFDPEVGRGGKTYSIGKDPIADRPSQTQYVMVPVKDESGNTSMAPQTPTRRGMKPSSNLDEELYEPGSIDESGIYSGGFTLMSDGVDENGDITLQLEGACPNCGVEFVSEDPTEPLPYTEKVSIVNRGFLGGRFRRQSLRPGAKKGRAHAGIDINAPSGSNINIPESGKVIHIGKAKGAGKNIQIMHPGGETSWLMHLKDIDPKLKVGSEVSRGQSIGKVGSTTGGKGATSPHIHYEVLKPGVSTEEKVRRPASHDQDNFDLRMDPLEFFKSTRSSPFSEQLSKKEYKKD